MKYANNRNSAANRWGAHEREKRICPVAQPFVDAVNTKVEPDELLC
jgi:hypothetical protein